MADKVEGDRGVPETKVEDVVVDEFADAYKEADVPGEKADLSAADDPAKMKDEPPVVVPPIIPPADVTPPVIPPVIEPPVETEEKYEQRYKTLQGIHKHDKDTWETEKVQLLSQLEEAKKPKTPEKPIVEPTKEQKESAVAFIDSLTDEQKQQLEQYEQDFDVVSKMEGIKRSVELGKLRKEMQVWKEEVASQLAAQSTTLDTRIAPVMKMAEDSERETHFDMIREGYVLSDGTQIQGHADFEKFRDDGSLMTWIESKPKYIQPALKETYSKGSAMDVIDLYSDFKRETNIPLTQPSDNVVPIDKSKAARKQALTTVVSRRAAVNPGTAVSQDFEGAFNEAIHK